MKPASGAQPVDQRLLRATLGAFATGVAIVTTADGDGRPVGLTINSFGSLSLDPPLVQWSLRRGSASRSVFDTSGGFMVNVLAANQQHLSQRFASAQVADKFMGVPLVRDAGESLPMLAGAIAHIACLTESVVDCGDHRMYIGRVRDFGVHEGRDPLVFCQGAYHALGSVPHLSRDRMAV